MPRPATRADIPAIADLIQRSARGLCTPDYTPAQVEAALRGAFGVDTQLIDDGTYFVIEQDHHHQHLHHPPGALGAGCDARVIVACGGWSKRKTMFGSDSAAVRDATELDPRVDAAKIRAFFVDPEAARRGYGRMLLEHCEAAARRAGFSRLELMATLSGVPLYERCGYSAGPRTTFPLVDGVTIDFIPMTKWI